MLDAVDNVIDLAKAVTEDQVYHEDAQQRKPANRQPHDGAAAVGNFQCLRQTPCLTRLIGHADV